MSEYKYLDKDGLIYYHSKVKTLLGGKVDKETGKGLSTNDYTTTEKNKLNGIASGAEVNQNAFSNIAVGSTTIQADSKTDTLTLTAGSNITLTPNATSDSITIAATTITVDDSLSSTSTNPVQNKVIVTALDAKAPLASPTFTGTPKAPTAAEGTNTTQIATTAFVTTAVATAIGSITGIKFEIVQTLPTTGENGTIYLVSHGGTGTNIYDEYVYVNNAWEKIGSTDIDLSNYVQKTDMVSITNAEIDTIVS